MFDSDSLYGLLFVATRPSCAPSTLFGFCFCSFQRKPGCHYGHSIGPNQQNVWWHLFLVAGNHPTCSSVKWEALPFFFQKILGCNLQGAATCRLQVYMRKICLKPFTSKYCGTFMNHPGLWFLPQQHWYVPRHVRLWQKILVILPATFALTVLTISKEYSGRRGIFRQSWSRLSRELLESFPILVGLHTFWCISLPDTWNRFIKTRSQQPGGLEHTRTLTMLNRVCWG